MATIVMASNNRHKIREIEAFLRALCPADANGEAFTILSLDDIGFTDDIVEDGTTFEENALIKARTVAKLGYIGIADDSGLCGGKGQYGHVKIRVEPNEPGKGYEFINAVVGGAIPK